MFRRQRFTSHFGANAALVVWGPRPARDYGAVFRARSASDRSTDPALALGARIMGARLGALILMGALLLGNVVVAAHHDCHAAGDDPCPICWYTNIASCLPDSTPPPPAPNIEQRLVLLAIPQLGGRPLFAVFSRGPPAVLP